MKTADFDYDLPKELIAQHPLEKRDGSRLMVLDRANGRIEHRVFSGVTDYAEAGDVLVVNDTRVIRARLYGHRSGSGGLVEVLLVRPAADEAGGRTWEVMLRARGRLQDGETIMMGDDLSATLLGRDERGVSRVRLDYGGDLQETLDRYGRMPLPPYIKRPKTEDPDAAADAERYQTVYAKEPGAVAAPTAGLHFTPELLRAVEAKGCRVVAVTLHVGPGTFKPVTADEVEDHSVDPESFAISAETAETINAAKRVIAVGTTTCRVLETVSDDGGRVAAGEGWTNLFIRPPYRFKAVDRLITNFHLPKSSLLMLVSAFATREIVLGAYQEAVGRGYRFYSYGDAMIIL